MNLVQLGDLGSPLAQLQLELGESIQVASESLVSMSPGIVTRLGAWPTFDRAMRKLGLKSMAFPVVLAADDATGLVLLSGKTSGAMAILHGGIEGIFIQEGLQLAADPTVESAVLPAIKVGRRNRIKAYVRCSGGGVLVQSNGHLYSIDIPQFEVMIVAPHHLAAFSGGVQIKPAKLRAHLAPAVASGHGWMLECTGPGRVWIQGRAPYIPPAREAQRQREG